MSVVERCRHPGLPCDRLCMECRGDFDTVPGRPDLGSVDDTTAINRMLREFGEYWKDNDE